MAGELLYTTIEFSKSHPGASEAAKTEDVVYSEITRTKEEASISAVPAGKVSPEIVTSPRYTSYRQATVALGLLCLLLFAGLITMCVLNIEHVSKYTSVLTLYTNESVAHRRLQVNNTALETEKDDLSAQRAQLQNTLRLITQYNSFPVRQYCTSTNEELRCEPCMKGWIRNGSSCYLFWKSESWLTWAGSQKYCSDREGHLVAIDTEEEQEFISQQTPYYYDSYHGYWIGLSDLDGLWIWTTGAKLQGNGFWVSPPKGSQGSCVLSKPLSAAIKNWEAKSCSMYNRFICEMKVMEWPSQM